MVKYLICFLIFCISCVIAHDSDEHITSGVALSLGEAISRGVEKSEVLKEKKWGYQAQKEETKALESTRFPKLSANVGYTRTNQLPDSEIRLSVPGFPSQVNISKHYANHYALGAKLTQELFTGFKKTGLISQSKAIESALKHTVQSEENNVIFSIEKNYWNLHFYQELCRVLIKNTEMAQSHLLDVEHFYNQGLTTKNEVMRAKTRVSQDELLQIEADNLRQVAQSELNRLIDFDLDRQLHLSTPLVEAKYSFPSIDTLYDIALKQRGEVKEMNSLLRASKEEIKVAKSTLYPFVSFSANAHYNRPNFAYFPYKNRFKYTWDLGICIYYDIWEWSKTSHKVKAAKSNYFATLMQKENTLEQVKLEVKEQYLKLKEAEKSIAVAEKAVKEARETFDLTSDRYKEGLALNSDVLETQVNLLHSEIDLLQKRVDFAIYRVGLEKALGKISYSQGV